MLKYIYPPNGLFPEPPATAAEFVLPIIPFPLSLWSRSDLTFSDAGVTPAVDGGRVQQWNDKSGNLFHFINAGPLGRRPILKTGIVNARNVLRFDGTDDYIQSLFAGLVQPNTIFLVFNDISGPGGGGGGYIIGGTTGGPNREIVYNYPAGVFPAGNLSLTANGGATNVGFPITFPTGFMVLTVVVNGGSSVLRKNGVQMAIGNAGTLDLTGITLAAADDGFTNSVLDIAEIIVYNALVDLPSINLVENYLNGRYAIY